MKKIGVLVVDDSAAVRQAMREILESDPAFEVIGTAADPFAAAEIIKCRLPDVITLDVEMPRMDGLTFLDKLMHQRPVPVVMCSTLTERGSATALAALEKGAVDIIAKPRLGTREFFEESRVRICDVVRAAAHARMRPRPTALTIPAVVPKLTADVVIARPSPHAMIETTEKVIVVGASTGGTEALRIFLSALPEDSPGVVVVQHMPAGFTTSFAARLDSLCRIEVREAATGDAVVRGRALIAPGNRHLLLHRSGARYHVEVRDGPLVTRHRPSVDVLFRSAARYAGANAIGIIMTGMGDDGARGLLEMKQAGARTLAQDEASCVVFGMPAEAIKLGAVDRVLPLDQLGAEVLTTYRSPTRSCPTSDFRPKP